MKKHQKRQKRGGRSIEARLASMEQRMRQALPQRIAQARSMSTEDPVEFMDIVVHSEMDDMALRIVESDCAKIEEIREARHRIREGQYGLCRSCGESIPAQRLKARPFATLCTACKEAEERTRRAAGYIHLAGDGAVSLDLDGDGASADGSDMVVGEAMSDTY